MRNNYCIEPTEICDEFVRASRGAGASRLLINNYSSMRFQFMTQTTPCQLIVLAFVTSFLWAYFSIETITCVKTSNSKSIGNEWSGWPASYSYIVCPAH